MSRFDEDMFIGATDNDLLTLELACGKWTPEQQHVIMGLLKEAVDRIRDAEVANDNDDSDDKDDDYE